MQNLTRTRSGAVEAALPMGMLAVVALLTSGTGCVYDWPTSIIPNDGGPGDGQAECGNGQLEPGEVCDGTRLGNETCASQGFGGGVLACGPGCTFDTSGCAAEERCGDGFVGATEGCDDGGTGDGDGCSVTCQVEAGWACTGEPSVCTGGCGNGVCYAEGGEDAASCVADCGWIHLAAGRAHTCGVKGDGTVWCWGDNADGQLGDGSGQDQSSPSQVTVPAAQQVVVGGGHSCALTRAGTVWCWGDNADGQLGDGSIIPRPAPVEVAGLYDVVSLAAGDAHTCVATLDLEAWCWGRNTDGQLGDGTPTSRQFPTAVAIGAGLTSARRVTAGGAHSCALREDDTVWCWGANASGQLGTGDTQASLLPLPVDPAGDLATAQVVSAGAEHTCALDDQGTLYCWGNGDQRRLGDGASQSRPSPTAVISVGVASDVVAGGSHSCAVAADGGLWCWGLGTSGQLGTVATPPQANPSIVVGLTGGIQVTAGALHSCARLSDGRAWCWGAGSDGQLGHESSAGSATAVPVSDPY